MAITSQYASVWVSLAVMPLAYSPSPSQHSNNNRLGLELELELEPELPKYQMSCTAKTMEALWREWTVGLQDEPSIDRLDQQ